MSDPTPPLPPSDPPPSASLPWETAGVSWFDGLLETVKLFFTDPRRGFAGMPLTGELTRPLLYAVIVVAGAGIIINLIYTIFPGMLSFLSGDMGAAFLATPLMVMFSLVVFPLMTVLMILITAGVCHLCLSLVGGANAPFAVTVRTTCYAVTPSILFILPLCGNFIAGIWTLYLLIVGLTITHQTTTGKAALAVLLPNILCCGLSLAFGLLGGLLAGLAGG